MAVDVRPVVHALVLHPHELGEAHQLVAAAVGEDGTVPAHERVQSAERRYGVDPGTLREVIRVGEHDVRADLVELSGCQALHRAERSDRHERRRLDGAVRRHQASEPRPGRILAQHLEGEAVTHVISIASPKL